MYSNNIYNGLITAKQFWFYGAMALLITVFSIDLLISGKNVSVSLNIIDISLLIFYAYFLIRSAFTPFTPLLYNTKFLNISLLVILYFIIKVIIVFLKSHSVVTQWSFNGHSIVKQIYNNRMTHEVQMTAQPNDAKRMAPEGQMTSNSKFISIIIHVVIITGLIQAIWGLLQLYGFARSFHSGFKITGTFFNPAPYALYLAAIFPLALGKLFLIKELKNEEIKELNNVDDSLIPSSLISFITKIPAFFHSLIPSLLYYISLITVISIILVLPATMNRASWVGAAAGSFLVFNYRYKLLDRAKAFLNNTGRKLFAIVIIVVLIGLSGAGLFYLKKGSSTGKLLIWEVTIGKITEKPLFGYGIGRFEADYNNWQAGYFRRHPAQMDGPKGMAAGNTKYCFNEYLEIAAELGFIGLILFIVVLVSPFMPQSKGLRAQGKTFPALFNLLTPSLITLLVSAAVSFPLCSLPTLILLFILLAFISTSTVTIAITRLPTEINKTLRITGVMLLFSIIIFLSSITKKEYKSYYTMYEAVMLYQFGSYNESCESFSEVSGNMRYNGPYLQYYAKALLMAERYEESIKMYERAKDYTGDDILYCSMGDAYKAMKRYDVAGDVYIHASLMAPHKLYPLYLLVLLYKDSGQDAKAVEVAKKILNKNVKIESEATREIQVKMRRIIENK